jgi:tetratricopeptide (TPR) repeat protein
MTIRAQYEVGEIRPNISMRFINAVISYVSYLKKLFFPVDLAVFYPFEYSFPTWQILGACLILLGITISVISLIRRMPFLFVGWFWYLGTLVPVIGLVPVNAPIADRYTYLSSIGTAIMLAWGVPLLFPRADIRKKILIPISIAILFILSFLTYRQCGYWKDSITLLSHTLLVTKDNYLAHNNRGAAYLALGQYQQAIEDFNEAIRLTTNYDIAYNNRGLAYYRLGQYNLAIKDFNEAINLKPDYIDAYKNRASAYAKLGKRQPAEDVVNHYNELTQLKPNPAGALAYVNRANAYIELGRYQNALADYNEAIRLKPDYADAYYDRGTAYARYGQCKLAIEDLNKAISLKNNFAKAYNNRGLIFARLNQYQNAIINFNEAIRLNPQLAECYLNRSKLYFIQGNNLLGCLDAQKACEQGACKLLEWFKNKGLCQ